MEKAKKTKFLTYFVLAIIFFVALPVTAQAANFYFTPSSGSYSVGSSITVGIYVSSVDQAINAASGVISFPNDKLSVVSISKTGSIFSLWVQEPSFSNSAGTINFEGIVLNPGFTGSSGKIISATFKVKAIGAASLIFSSGSALANDGNGTNILAGLGNAQFSLGPTASEATTPSEVTGTPLAPQISSSTHPDPTHWYAQKDAKFTWIVPTGITSAQSLVGKISSAVPTVIHTPATNQGKGTNLADGIWYFSVRLKNSAGWGGISHFRFQIDTEKPSSFNITEITRTDLTEPKAKFIFDAKDELSGIDYYEINIDDENAQIWNDDGTKTYITPALEPGKHTLIAKAFDKAGNSLANSAEFTIEALNSPIITDYPKQLSSGDILIVHGLTYPNSKVNIWLQKEKDDPKSFIVESDQDGKFTFSGDEKLGDGIYQLWAEAVDARGAKSLPSEKVTIVVEQPTIFRIGNWAINFLAVIVPLALLIISLLFIVWYGWHKFSLLRKKLRKEVSEAESVLYRALDLFKDDIQNQIEMLEETSTKRRLTNEEVGIIKQLRKDLDSAEKFMKKEIQDIEKEIK